MALRIAVVGAGSVMQLVHLPSLRAIRGVGVVALADLDRTLGGRVAAAFGVPRVYGDVAELLDGERGGIDGVVVVCGKQWHASACLPALRAGLPVFTEKPLAATLADGRAMVDAAAASGTRLMVGYMKRFDPAVVEAVRLLKAGAIGEVRYARIHDWGGDYICGRPVVGGAAIAPPPPPEAQTRPQPQREAAPRPAAETARAAFDQWIEVWVHDVNLAQGLFGPMDSVTWSAGPSPKTALVRCAEGVDVLFEVGGPQPGGMPWDETVEVFGSRGRLSLAFKPPFLLHARTSLRLTLPSGVTEPACGHAEAFLEEMRHFCHCVATGVAPNTDGAMGLADLEACARLVSAAYPDDRGAL